MGTAATNDSARSPEQPDDLTDRPADTRRFDVLKGLSFVAVGVVLFSTSPVLVRAAAPFGSIQTTFGRMAAAAVCLLIVAAIVGEPIGPARGDWVRFAVYGLIAALHFLFFVASVNFTTIAHSLAIVYTAPVFVTACAALFLKERLPRRKLIGIPIVVLGIAILTGLEPHLTPTMVLGDVLALGSAICFGLYSVAGRRERRRYSLIRYAGTVYASAAIWLAPFALIDPIPAAPIGSVFAIVVLGVFPLAIGHTLYNASLRRVHPTYVNLIATQEVTGGIILGGLLLGEWPPIASAVGAIVSLVGVAIVLVLDD